MKSVLVIAASARAAAESLCRAGFEVHAADHFGDHETRAASSSWQSITELQNRTSRDQASRDLQQLPAVLGGGLLGDPGWLRRLSFMSGLAPEMVVRINQPSFLYDLATDAAVAFPETTLRAHLTKSHLDRVLSDPNGWLVKPIHSCGGIGISVPRPGMLELSDQEMLQRRINGRSIGLCFLAQSTNAIFIGATRQLRRRPARGMYLYGGSVGPVEVDAVLQGVFERIGQAFADRVPLDGPFNVDVMVDANHQVSLLEVNPRYSASMELVERAWSTRTGMPCSVFEPIETWRDRLGRPREPQGVLVKRVLYSSQRQRIDPETLRKHLESRQWHLTDTPNGPSMFERDEPIATLIAPFSIGPFRAEQALRHLT
ncbi:MAG: ATP-grasp domain-containing protein [Planctomycetota bacterium]